MRVRTRGNSSPRNKTKVFFTCHLADWDRSFDKICEDILGVQDVAIYYMDITESDSVKDPMLYEIELRQMCLFIIPVSYNMLTDASFARDIALPFAKNEHIPILPILLEHEIDYLYSKEENFGKRQYLDPFSHDETVINYEKKLNEYLASILMDSNLNKRIRNAFKTYAFLSYRKKDRIHANNLMHILHNNPYCRDVAIWYDEFLVPGELFDEAIYDAMKKCSIFTMLVTPNLINEDNYVQKVEFPQAKSENISILPVEMIKTSRKELEEKYPGIPQCINVNDEDRLRDCFKEIINQKTIAEYKSSPEHTYLIGLAYLEGIDVEVDREWAVKQIIDVAESGYLEGMKKIAHMYRDGIGVEVCRPKYFEWYERYATQSGMVLDSNSIELLSINDELASIYIEFGQNEKALELCLQGYKVSKQTLGMNHPDTLRRLNNLAYSYSASGNVKKAIDIYEKLCEIILELADQNSIETPFMLGMLNNLATEYSEYGQHDRSLELLKAIYDVQLKVMGEDNPSTINTLGNLAVQYGNVGNFNKELLYTDMVYKKAINILGENHPDTLRYHLNLAYVYGKLNDHETALSIAETVYDDSKKVLGDDHPQSLRALNIVACEYGETNDHERSLELLKFVHEKRIKVLGEDHPDTIRTLNNLALEYETIGEVETAYKLLERACEKSETNLGGINPETIRTQYNLASIYSHIGNHNRALELYINAYKTGISVLDKYDPILLNCLHNLALEYAFVGKHENAIELMEREYALISQMQDNKKEGVIRLLNNLAHEYSQIGEHEKSSVFYIKAYTVSVENLGEDNPTTTSINENLSYEFTLFDGERLINNKKLFYNLSKELLGANDPQTIKALQNALDISLDSDNDDFEDESSTLCENGTDLIKEYECLKLKLGENNPQVISRLNDLATHYVSIGDPSKALELYEQVIQKRKDVLGLEHKDTLQALVNTISLYDSLGDHERANEVRKMADDIRIRIKESEYESRKDSLGIDHPDTIRSLHQLADAYSKIGNHQKAIELYSRTYELEKSVLGEGALNTIITIQNLASNYDSIKESAKALELYSLACEISTRRFGEDNSMTQSILKNIKRLSH